MRLLAIDILATIIVGTVYSLAFWASAPLLAGFVIWDLKASLWNISEWDAVPRLGFMIVCIMAYLSAWINSD